MDVAWHANVRPFFEGVEAMNHKNKELQQAVKFKKSEVNKGQGQWALKEAKDKGVAFYDLGSVQQIQELKCGELFGKSIALGEAPKHTQDEPENACASDCCSW